MKNFLENKKIFQVWKSSKSTDTSDNNQSQTNSLSSFSHDWMGKGDLEISTDHTTGWVGEDFDIGTQNHQISKCCGSLDRQIEPWQSSTNAPQTLFHGNLYCHVHPLVSRSTYPVSFDSPVHRQ